MSLPPSASLDAPRPVVDVDGLEHRTTLYVPPDSQPSATHVTLSPSFSFPPITRTSTSPSLRLLIDSLTSSFPFRSLLLDPQETGPGRHSSPPLFLLTTWMRPDPATQVVGGAGSGLTPGAQSPLRSPGGGGGRGQPFRAVARVPLPSCLPSALPSRLPSLTSRLERTRGGSPEGSLGGRRVHVDAGTGQ